LGTLWAPWRIDYILAEKGGNCFLCDSFRAPPEQDDETLVLSRGERVFSVMNRYPYNTGHVMIAPVRHVPSLADLSPPECMELMEALNAHVEAMKASLGPDGFNVGINLGKAAGAGVEDHLHVHVVPRWVGDTNYMQVTAQTRVMPESLVATRFKIKISLHWPKK